MDERSSLDFRLPTSPKQHPKMIKVLEVGGGLGEKLFVKKLLPP